MTLGGFGELTLDEARSLARKRLVEIEDGRDPLAERRQRNSAPTFRDLEQMYLTRHASLKKSRANDEGILNYHLAHLRPRKLTSLTRDEIARLHSRIGT